MAEQFCTRALYSLVQLVHHRRSFLLAFCVLNFVFSVVATLENLLVIRALMKASTIPVTVKKLFLSLAFSDLAVGLWSQFMTAVISASILKMESSGNNTAFFCPTVLGVKSYFLYLLGSASLLNVIVIAFDRLLAVSFHLRYQELITPKRVNIALVSLWLISCITAFIFVFLPTSNEIVAAVILVIGYVFDHSSICSYLQSRQISSESDIQAKSASKCPNKGGTPTKEVRLQCYICLSCFSSLLSSFFALNNTVHDKYFRNFVYRR